MPPGTAAPFILTYSASTVPILQLAISSNTLSEAELNDYAQNFIRPDLVTIPGAEMPYPYGGKQRQINVSLNTGLLQSKGLSPADVVTAIGNQNIILPAGTAKIGQFEYDVRSEFQSAHGGGAERSAHQAVGQQHADLCS